MKITVTQDDIDLGLTKHCRLCPTALALARAMGHQIFVSRYTYANRREDLNTSDSRKLPKVAQNFIMDFDMELPVKPFSFEV